MSLVVRVRCDKRGEKCGYVCSFKYVSLAVDLMPLIETPQLGYEAAVVSLLKGFEGDLNAAEFKATKFPKQPIPVQPLRSLHIRELAPDAQ